ncbi:MAG: hypothetical protein FWE20_03330 [Defluviitaleaceae bacterium]|nr:hypothetical protein [Defluviitaleaceae bacterium]
MSSYIFLSSDKPLKEVDNCRYEMLSVEEAEARGIQMWFSEYIAIPLDTKLHCSPEIALNHCDSGSNSASVKGKCYTSLSRTDKIVMYAPDEEALNELVIKTGSWLEGHEDPRGELNLSQPYRAEIGFLFTDERARQLIEYIREHLEGTPEIELRHIWLGAALPGDSTDILTRRCNISHLTPSVIREYLHHDTRDGSLCITVYKDD